MSKLLTWIVITSLNLERIVYKLRKFHIFLNNIIRESERIIERGRKSEWVDR